MATSLTEYHWNGSKYVASNNVFTFSPEPKSITKDSKVEWRVRHSGSRKEFKKIKWRFRRTEIYKFNGILDYESPQSIVTISRQELESLATRNSVFKITTAMKSLKTNATLAGKPLETGSYFPPQVENDAYFIITDCSFSQVPGKVEYEYNLTLERVYPTQGVT